MSTPSAQAPTTRIVAAMDFEETGDNAVREALRLSRLVSASELHVVHVIKLGSDLPSARRLEEISDSIHKTWESMKEHVLRVCAPVGKDSAAFSQEAVFHVRLGDPADAIHQLAVDVDADMVIVGTHARTGLRKMMLGSVAEKLCRTAHLPVIIAHPKATAGMPKSAKADAARPGEDLHSGGMTDRLMLEFVPRTTHISGLV